jgi:tricorn protease
MADRAGRTLENHPRPVDDEATRPIGESYSAHDSQLDLAVSKLLAQIGGGLKLPAILGR